MTESKLIVPVIICSYILGFATGDVFGPHVWDKPPGPGSVEIVELEPRKMDVRIERIPLECPAIKCPNFTVPDWKSRKVDRAWGQYERAAKRFDNAISELEYAQISCDNAFYGWSFASMQWQAACNGEREGVCE